MSRFFKTFDKPIPEWINISKHVHRYQWKKWMTEWTNVRMNTRINRWSEEWMKWWQTEKKIEHWISDMFDVCMENYVTMEELMKD